MTTEKIGDLKKLDIYVKKIDTNIDTNIETIRIMSKSNQMIKYIYSGNKYNNQQDRIEMKQMIKLWDKYEESLNAIIVKQW